jgi:hypothetical protein
MEANMIWHTIECAIVVALIMAVVLITDEM